MVSSTEGSPTNTGWKRRSSAASFSMCLRYSSSVVAPIRRSSPRASIGLIMLPASIAPSAAPAPTMVCSSSMKVMTSPSASVISFSTAFRRSSNSPRYFAPATIAPRSSATTPLVAQALGHVALDDAVGEALDDGRLADAGLADEHRVVLRAPRQDLDDAADLLVAPDDGVELAPAGRLGEVAPVALERLVLLLGVLARDPVAAAHRLQRVEERRRRSDADADVGQRQRGGVLGGEIVVAEVLAGAVGRLEGPRRCRARAGLLGAAVDLGLAGEGLVDPVDERCGGDAHAFQDGQDDALGLAEQGGEQVLGLDLGCCCAPGPATARSGAPRRSCG